jgi:hypothetical protein
VRAHLGRFSSSERAVVAAKAPHGRGLVSVKAETAPCDDVVKDIPTSAPTGLSDVDMLHLT